MREVDPADWLLSNQSPLAPKSKPLESFQKKKVVSLAGLIQVIHCARICILSPSRAEYQLWFISQHVRLSVKLLFSSVATLCLCARAASREGRRRTFFVHLAPGPQLLQRGHLAAELRTPANLIRNGSLGTFLRAPSTQTLLTTGLLWERGTRCKQLRKSKMGKLASMAPQQGR